MKSNSLLLDHLPPPPPPPFTYRLKNKFERPWLQLYNQPVLVYLAVTPRPVDTLQLVTQCGKFAVLDRMLVKLQASGHRGLLFSTMTSLLGLLGSYLECHRIGEEQHRMVCLRIDKRTSVEDRWGPFCNFYIPWKLLKSASVGQILGNQTSRLEEGTSWRFIKRHGNEQNHIAKDVVITR